MPERSEGADENPQSRALWRASSTAANAYDVTAPSRENAFIVFAQRSDARVDIDGWNAHAARFFATRIGLTTEKRYSAGGPAPRTDEAEFVVAPEGEPPGVRSTLARPCDADDRALAETIDARAGNTGLGLLAQRCGMVWMVAREEPRDRLALRLAAILASILLGPVLDAAAGELFGVKTARSKLDAMVH
jgi:hypothetical protein